jgi:hypothetical protein
MGVSKKTIDLLQEEAFELEQLKTMNPQILNKELSNVSPRDIRKIKNWQRSVSRNLNSGKRSKSRSATKKNKLENLPPLNSGPVLARQNTVSELLLNEIVDNPDLRTRMDRLMSESFRTVAYLEQDGREVIEHSVTLHDHAQNGFKSDLKEDQQSIYYRWNKEDSKEAFHFSLNHTDNEKHSNRGGFHRDKNGALHIRLNDGYNNDGEHSGRGTLCRMLINYVRGEYVIHVCLPKTRHRYIEPITREVSKTLILYYEETGRAARISEDSGKGKGKGTRNNICKK